MLFFLFVRCYFFFRQTPLIFKTLHLYVNYKAIYLGVSVTFPQFFHSWLAGFKNLFNQPANYQGLLKNFCNPSSQNIKFFIF